MKKILSATVIALTLFLVVSKPLFAQSAQDQMKDQTLWYNYGPTQFTDKVFGSPPTEIFGERYTLAQVNWIINSLIYQNMGNSVSCLKDPTGCASAVLPMGSPLQMLASMNDTLISTKPVSGVEYIAQKINDYSPIKTAYAQQAGYGFKSLAPIQDIWLASRNVSFALMSFVIIILAFMIMLRQKISPQVVVSVQSALPKVAIALVVITFSYAIAGLLVDLAYVVMGLFSAILAASGLTTDSANVLNIFNNLNSPATAFNGWILIFGLAVAALGGVGAVAVFGTLGLAGGVVGIASAAIVLVVGILLAIAFFRIFITMLKAYATAIFLVIGFPFVALLSVVSIGPGIGGWIRQFSAQLAIFLGISFAVALSHLVFWTMSGGTFSAAIAGLANPYHIVGGAVVDNPQFPAFGGFNIGLLGFFIGFGVLFSAPKIAKGLSDQIATGRGSYGFDSTGAIAGPAVGIGSQAVNARMSVIEAQAKLAGTSAYSRNPVQYPLLQGINSMLKRLK